MKVNTSRSEFNKIKELVLQGKSLEVAWYLVHNTDTPPEFTDKQWEELDRFYEQLENNTP